MRALMITLLALLVMPKDLNVNDGKLVPYIEGHCYCTDSEFNARCLKILQVGNVSYRYAVETGAGYKGSFINTAMVVNDTYKVEVSCEKK